MIDQAPSTAHRLVVEQLQLLGGDRSVRFLPGLNLVTGPISTGKTTLVKLLEVALSVTPADLPPETGSVHALDLDVRLGEDLWSVYRPLVSTADATVSVARPDQTNDSDLLASAISVPARGFEGSYQRFLLDRLHLPAVAIPEGKATGTLRLNPVTMTDFLSYCIVRGEDLDSDVFGHDHPFRDNKRRFVFRLVYGLHDPELSRLDAEIKAVSLQISALDTEEVTIAKFLNGTPFAGREALEAELAAREQLLSEVDEVEQGVRRASNGAANEISRLRRTLLERREETDRLLEQQRDLDAQIASLDELERQLQSQSARLTRAIVADEWLVDFDFLVCPRCGTPVHPSVEDDSCYLCHQIPAASPGRDTLIAEQARVSTQVDETRQLRERRRISRSEIDLRSSAVKRDLDRLATDLDRASARFVSDRASELQKLASRRTRLETEMEKIREYAELFQRKLDRDEERSSLMQLLDDLEVEAGRRRTQSSASEGRIQALEKRMLSYLERMRVPSLGQLLSVKINRKTYLPEVSGRRFDELSSQGLKTLVNIAHALAHHTVAIDLGLPLPGLLVLDGISANTGYEGFDQARIEDAYKLMIEESAKYRQDLQLVLVDNTLPLHLFEDEPPVILELSHEDRLIRTDVTEGEDDRSLD